MTNRIRMAVLATNAEGSPDLYLTFVEATDLQYNEGRHYDIARARAEDEGYRAPMIAFDQNDAAADLLRHAAEFMEGDTDEVIGESPAETMQQFKAVALPVDHPQDDESALKLAQRTGKHRAESRDTGLITRRRVNDYRRVPIRGKQAEKIAITTPYSLYRRIYAGASARQDSDYFPDSSFEFVIRAKLKGISDALWKHVDRMEKTGQGPIFDHVGIGNISSNYYYAKSATKGIQVNLDSKIAFKQALRILLDIATSVIDIVSLKPLVDVDGIRRYAFSPHPYFLAFNDVADIQDFRAPSWRKTLNLFRIPNHDTVSKEALRAESGDST
ncbi:hypothetical protein KCU90_g390, partial [Aureobasidium melanogenum]